MSTTLKNIKIPYPTEGVIRSAQLNDTVTPENSVQLAINMNFDRVGAMQTRPGVATYATQRGGSVTSFGTLSILGSTKALFAQVGTDISAWNGVAWTSVRTTTVTTKARYSQWLNRTWMCNGSAGDAVMTSNGGAFATTDVPATFPKVDFIQAGFDGRVWGADASKDALYYTDIVQFNGTSYTTPLTFNLATNFIQWLSPQDGESMTAIYRVPKALLVFKQNHIYRVYSTSSVDAYPAYNVGTYSQESIVQAKDGLYFHHSSGFYKFAYDGQPVEISRRIIDFVKAIPRTSYENITGIWDGFDAVEWSIGSVTVEGVTYTNCVARYSISTQVWTIYDYAGNTNTAMIRYDDGTNLNSLVGTASGRVGLLDSGTTDFGSAIYYEMIDRWRSFTEMYSKSKNISGMMLSSENGAGTILQYQTEKTPANVWTDIDTVKDEYDALFPNANTDDFNNIRLRFRGNSTGTPMLFHGIEILSIQDKGLNEN
jgi:hypothetical protein